MIYLQSPAMLRYLSERNYLISPKGLREESRDNNLNWFKITHIEVADEHLELKNKDLYSRRFCIACNYLLLDQRVTASVLFDKLQITGLSYNSIWAGEIEVSTHLIKLLLSHFEELNPYYFFTEKEYIIYA